MSSAPEYVHVVKAKVCLVGGLGVGKTSLIRRYVLDEFSDAYVVTLGAKVVKRSVDLDLAPMGRVRVDLTLWDTMGEESLRPTLTEIILHGTKGLLAVCDATDGRSLGPMVSWIELTTGLKGRVPVEILLNKSDLARSPTVEDDALRIGRRHAAPCYLTSAKTGDNVAAAFEDIALRIAVDAFAESERQLDPVSLGLVVEASAKPRSLLEMILTTGLPPPAVAARIESLVRRGYLRAASIDLGPDGRPLLSFSATGKSFPPIEEAEAAEARRP